MEYHSSKVPNLSLVDLPGITHVSENEYDKGPEIIRKMVRKYIKDD